MAGGLVALLDDVAVLARAAAASIDDVGAAAAKAGAKAAGVVVDDAAVTPQYVRSLAAERELPIIKRIALGSLRNKYFIILPAVLLLSQFVPWLLTPILMLGGAYLCYEGAEKVWAKIAHHDADGAGEEEVQDETTLVSGAVRTDLILSAEIMVITLNEVIDEPFWSRLAILAIVAVVITVLVYGVVALIVKMDDAGLRLSQRSGAVATFRPRSGEGDAGGSHRADGGRHRGDAVGGRAHPAARYERAEPALPVRGRAPRGGRRPRRHGCSRRARRLARQHGGQCDPRADRRSVGRAGHDSHAPPPQTQGCGCDCAGHDSY